MSKDKKQSVSHFTEEQLTPLEQKFADAKANRDAGVEPYKIVPNDLFRDVVQILGAFIVFSDSLPETKKIVTEALEKMKQL